MALQRALPAMFVKVWNAAGKPQTLAEAPGVVAVRPDLLAILPVAGDPAIVEAAIGIAARLVGPGKGRREGAALVLPGEHWRVGGTAPSPPAWLLDELEMRPQQLPPGVHLTGHAVAELESRWSVARSLVFQSPTGRQVPFMRLREFESYAPPWRNADRPPLRGGKAVERHDLATALARLTREPACLVTGPLGSGKTRATWGVIQALGRRTVWSSCWSERSGGPSLATQIRAALSDTDSAAGWWGDQGQESQAAAHGRLLSVFRRPPPSRMPPLELICDDFERCRTEDRVLVQDLLEHPGLGQSFRLSLIARTGAKLSLPSLPSLEIPLFSSEELATLGQELFSGLSIPEEVQQRLLEAASPFPFALEEGAAQLIRERRLRSLYGSFFFTGSDDATYGPSARLVRHLESEMLRLGAPAPAWLLALVDGPAPPHELGMAAKTLGYRVEEEWHRPYVAARLLHTTPSPWGAAVSYRCAALEHAVRGTLPGEVSPSPRQLLGLLLRDKPLQGRASWGTYRLLAGTPEGVDCLLQAARQPASGASREELFDALTVELEAHRNRSGDPALELDLLWLLLPLAHRLGRLHHMRPALQRALELAEHDPGRLMPLTALKAMEDQNAGRLEEAEKSIQHALRLTGGTDARRKALLIIQLGKLLQRQERYPEARGLFDDLVPVLQTEGLTTLAAACQFHLGNIALKEQRLHRALTYHKHALSDRRRQHLPRQLGHSLSALGTVYLHLGDYSASLRHFEDARDVLVRHGRPGELSAALLGIGRALTRLGDYAAASQPLRQALRHLTDQGDRINEAVTRLRVAENHLYLGQADLAMEEARQAQFELRMVEAGDHLGDAEQILGRIRHHNRAMEDAGAHFQDAVEEHLRHGDEVEACFDRAFWLESTLACEDVPVVEGLCNELEKALRRMRYPERGEILDLRLYEGRTWLRTIGREEDDPLPLLERAHRELYRKTDLLPPELRHRFLAEIPEHRAIVDAATRLGIS